MIHHNSLTPAVWYALCLIWFIVTHINAIKMITKYLEKQFNSLKRQRVASGRETLLIYVHKLISRLAEQSCYGL